MKIIDKQFIYYIHFVGFNEISLGFHVDIASPNIEIHLPFCFIKIGWQGVLSEEYFGEFKKRYRTYGKQRNN